MTESDQQQIGERSRLLTLVFTDLVDSVGLKSRLGDTEAGSLITAHQTAVRELFSRSGGREILVAGDGSFLTFDTPSQAVEFALNLQDHHRRVASLPQVRVGVHMGEVTERLNPPGAPRRIDIEGLAVDMASRIQTLAEPRQILLSYPVFDNARQRLDSSHWSLPVEWRAHGRYVFKGTEMSLEVFEVGLKSVAPFTPPTGGSKAQRDVLDDEEQTLGWRPAQGLELPGRHNWLLVEKLGEGGFGDVWLAEHKKTHEQHVVKFCYSTDRLRTLKREVTLFRLLKESLGTRPDIARVLDFNFDFTPYYLEMEYAGQNTLASWITENGGALEIPLDVRLEVVAQLADAIAAAHSAGVLHKDIKPSNIMVESDDAGNPRIKVIDFGIGALEDSRVLDGKGITVTGFTEAEESNEYGTSLTGTRLYMAPELIEGRPATTKSDIYSLGVLLFQMVAGKMGQALATGWERDVDDEQLRQDIAACVDGAPSNRLKSAEELAWRLRHLAERHSAADAERLRVKMEAARHLRHRRVWMYGMFAAAATLVLLMVFGLYAYLQSEKAKSEAVLRRGAEASRELAIAQEHKAQIQLAKAQQARYYASIALAEASMRENRYAKAQEVLLSEPDPNLLKREWGWLLAQTSPEDFALKSHNFYDADFLPDGEHFIIASKHKSGVGYISYHNTHTAVETTSTDTNTQMVWTVAVGPDGKYAATASRDRVISIVNLKTREVVNRLTGHSGIVRDVSFSEDGKLLASCARDQSIRLWDLDKMELLHAIPLGNESPTEVAFSPDSRYMVVGSLEGLVHVYDTASATMVCRLSGTVERALSVCFTADGQAVVATDTDGQTNLYHWPPYAGQTELLPYLSIKSNDTYPTQVIQDVNGEHIYIGNDNGQVVKANVKTGAQEMSFTVDQPLWKLDLSFDGRRMLTTTRWSVRLIDLDRIDDASTATALSSIRRVPDDVTTVSAKTVFYTKDQTWRGDNVWRTTSGLSLVKTNRGQKFLVQSQLVVFSPDLSQRIVINEKTLKWKAVDVATGKTLRSIKSHYCVGAVFSPDGKRVAIMYDREKTVIYSTSNWKALFTIPKIESPAAALFSADSRRLLLGDNQGVIREYSAFTGKQLRQLSRRGIGMPLDMEISNNGMLLAVGLDQDKAIVINMATGDQVSTMSGHVRYVHGVKFSPDNQRLITLSRDGTVKMWDVTTGRELVTLFSFKNGVIPLGLSFDRSGRMISVVTSDHRVMTTELFPWNLTAYGESDLPLEDRIELWKRRVRLGLDVTSQDMQL